MDNQTTEALLAALMESCGLGAIIQAIEPVSGGFMHRMYRVVTDSGVYAVKRLNAEIMKRPDALANYARAERIEGVLERGGLPVVPALTIGGRKMQRVGDQFFYVFRWQEGRVADWHHISGEMCRQAGRLLGQVHAIAPRNVAHEPPETRGVDWRDYIPRAREACPEIAALLEENEALLVRAEDEWNKARAALPAMRCLSNGDMDPKNILWHEGRPWMIDLECLDEGNPVDHAMSLALQWAGVVTCALDTDKLIAFFDGYLDAYDNGFRAYGDVAGVAYTWLEWLEYNVQRALGACADEEERALGLSEARRTMARIGYIHQEMPRIREALRDRLRPRDAARYDTHDGRICYYELLLEGELADVPTYSLPAGYRFVPYADGDRDAWIEIEQSAKEFETYEQGLAAWNRYYADHADILPDRMVFIENERGEKIATATAFYDIYGRDTSGAGWLHWVAVKRAYQGRALSKPLITHALHVMARLGYTRAKIPTQTNTWLACKVYLDLGFRPIRENLAHSAEGWRIIRDLTGHSALQGIEI